MSVTPSSGVTGSQSSQSGAAGASSTGGLNQNVFLQLLVSQLQYQNPMQPMNSSTFITQLAAFQTVQDLQSIQTSLNTLVQDESKVLAQSQAPTAAAGQIQGTGTQGSGSPAAGAAS